MKFNDELYKKTLERYTLTKDGIYVLKTINQKGRIKK